MFENLDEAYLFYILPGAENVATPLITLHCHWVQCLLYWTIQKIKISCPPTSPSIQFYENISMDRHSYVPERNFTLSYFSEKKKQRFFLFCIQRKCRPTAE